jgi:hypothetical protein
MGVQQKLMRHAQIATTMKVYGDAMMESKRTANSKVVERYFGRRFERPNEKDRRSGRVCPFLPLRQKSKLCL